MNKLSVVIVFLPLLFVHFAYGQEVEVKVSANSVLNKSDRYAAKNVLDGNLETAWCAAHADRKSPLVLKFTFAKATDIAFVMITGGYFKDPFYEKNNRIRNATLKINSDEIKLNFEQTGAYRSLFPYRPETPKQGSFFAIWKSNVSQVELEIGEVLKGDKFNDTCISEIHFVSPQMASAYVKNELKKDANLILRALEIRTKIFGSPDSENQAELWLEYNRLAVSIPAAHAPISYLKAFAAPYEECDNTDGDYSYLTYSMIGFKNYLELYPSGPHVDEAWYYAKVKAPQYACSSGGNGFLDERAEETLMGKALPAAVFMDRFPTSSFANEARKMVDVLADWVTDVFGWGSGLHTGPFSEKALESYLKEKDFLQRTKGCPSQFGNA